MYRECVAMVAVCVLRFISQSWRLTSRDHAGLASEATEESLVDAWTDGPLVFVGRSRSGESSIEGRNSGIAYRAVKLVAPDPRRLVVHLASPESVRTTSGYLQCMRRCAEAQRTTNDSTATKRLLPEPESRSENLRTDVLPAAHPEPHGHRARSSTRSAPV